MEVNYQKDWKVTRGPFLLFDGSFVLEFLEPDEELDATTLVRATYKANHPLLRKGKSHPQAPPLHIHWDQFETFKVLQGTVALTMGYEQKEIVLTPDNTPFKIPPMVPHLPYPHPELTGKGEDTVALLWAHPTNIPNPMDDMFFEHLFRYLDKCQNEKKSLDFLQVALSQHEAATSTLLLPSLAILGPLRWWIPLTFQAGIAWFARLMGYSPLIRNLMKDE